MLTNYNGTAINYDEIGNPLNWRNATNLTWEARELQNLVIPGGPAITFEYNSSGIRTKKTVGGTIIHDYILDGSKIHKEIVTNNGSVSYELYYLYDSSGVTKKKNGEQQQNNDIAMAEYGEVHIYV